MKRIIFRKEEMETVYAGDCNILNYFYGIENGNKRYILTSDYTIVYPKGNFKQIFGKLSNGGTTPSLEELNKNWSAALMYEFETYDELVKWAVL